MSMRVLVIGFGESYHLGAVFQRAVKRLGHTARLFDVRPYSVAPTIFHKLAYYVRGQKPLKYRLLNEHLLDTACAFMPDVVLVTGLAHANGKTLGGIRERTGAALVNYMTDDPFNPTHRRRDAIEAIPVYDLYVSTKRAVIPDLLKAGAQRTAFVRFAYDPALHFPQIPSMETAERWLSDVVFIGGADRDRVECLHPIAEDSSIRLCLYGGSWHRHRQYRRYYRGFANGEDYRYALSGTSVGLCLVRRANRDGHVMRTFEIPACGAFMLAERTEEHLELFEEDKQVAFFSSPEELLDKARYYLRHPGQRALIARAGHEHITSHGHTYADRLRQILQIVDV